MARITEMPDKEETEENDQEEEEEEEEEEEAAAPEMPQPPQIKPKMFIAPLLLLGGKKLGIDYEVPETLMQVRIAFVCAVMLCLGCCGLLYFNVNGKKKKLSEDKVEVRTKDPMQGGKEKVENLTYFEHDMREIGKAFTNQLVGFGVVGVMHLYMKVNPPLLLQTVMMPMNLWDMPVFQVHALGKDATKTPALKRPWKPEEQPNPFADLAKALNPEADKPAAGDKPKVKGVKKVRKGPRRAN